METIMLQRLRGMSLSGSATRRRRSCRASSEGELLLESVPESVVYRSEIKMPRTVNVLRNSHYLEGLHPRQTFLKLLDERRERRLGPVQCCDLLRGESIKEQLSATRDAHWITMSQWSHDMIQNTYQSVQRR